MGYDIQALANTVRHMQKCLECSICLHTLVAPVTTRCNHLFCKKCIATLFSKKGTKAAKCPLCKESITRRSIFHSELLESSVIQLQKLITAIETDTGVDLFSYARLSSHSKESNTPLKIGQNGGNPQKQTVAESAQTFVGIVEPKSLPQSSSKKNQYTGEYLQQASTSTDTRYGVVFDAGLVANTDKAVLISDTSNRPEKPVDIRVNSSANVQDHGEPSILDKTSCDKLSSSNQNWSQVKIFGKEMRKRKKKKISPLDISIESGKRTEKPVELANDSNVAHSRPPSDSEEPIPSNSQRNKSNMPESLNNVRVPESPELNERLPNIEDTYPQASSTPKNLREQTPPNNNSKSPLSDTLPLLGSPFLTFEEGTQVRIRSLNDQQLKDILGITCTQESNVADKDKPLKKRRNSYKGSPLKLSSPTSRKSQEKSPRPQTPVQRDKPNDLVIPPSERQSDKVAFKKLGRITRQARAKPCKFLYLGACRQIEKPTSVISTSVITSLKPCNTVEIRTSKAAGNFPELQGSLGDVEEVTFTKTIVATESNETTSLTRDLNETMKTRSPSRMQNTSKVKVTSRNKENEEKKASAKKIMRTNAIAGSSASRIVIPESIDVVFESQIETAVPNMSPNLPRVTEVSNETTRIETSTKKQTHINGVKMLSPEKDSQLQFLTIDSPMTENARTSNLQRTPSNTSRNNNFNTSRVMGEHSRELIRRSQQRSSDNRDSDTLYSPKSRKRSADVLNESQSRSSKKTERESKGSDNLNASIRSNRSSITQKKTKLSIRSSTDESEMGRRIPSHSSDTDIMSDAEEPPRKKKNYKRIRRLSTSSGDGVEAIEVESKNPKNSAIQSSSNTPATKRSFLSNADVNINIEEIAESWCTDAYARGDYSKKGRVDSDRTASNLRNSSLSIKNTSHLAQIPSVIKDFPLSSKDLLDSEPFSIEKQADFSDGKNREARAESDVIVDDNDEFNSIIDRVRKMQKTDLLQDNFNDVIANVDTALFLDDAVLSSNDSAKPTNASPQGSCASDKENNDCQRPPKASLFGKRKIDLDKTHVPTLISTAEINRKGSEVQRQSVKDNESTKESSCEQDSLMNITQHQLLLQQFEEDLFNVQSTRNLLKTPKSHVSQDRKRKDGESPRNPNQDPSSSISKDTESCSGEEDDIVESTPETKTKTRRGSISSSASTLKSVRAQAQQIIHELSRGSETPSVAKTDKVTHTNQRNVQRVSTNSTPSSRECANTDKGSSVIGEKRNPGFVCSSLGSAEIKSTRALAGMFAASYSNQFHRDVTHVIVRADPEMNAADKTLKYLQGVAHRKWVVRFEWVVECHRQKMLVNEEPYEVLDSSTFEAGPRNSRLRKSDLFEDFAFFCYGPYVNITTEQYKDLLHATGGEVVDTVEALVASSRKYRIIVIQADTYQDKIIEWYRKARAVPVSDDWIVECISQYKLISLYTHLQELLPHDVLALGYPSFLVAEDTEVDDSMDTSDE